jgi:hypothetical protein
MANFKEEVNHIDEKVKEEVKIPYGYISLDLSTKGKFDCPATIHVKDLTTNDLLEITSASEDYEIESTLKVLNNVIYEDVEVEKLLDQEVVEIFLNIYANFYSDVLENYSFPITDLDIDYLQTNKPELVEALVESGKGITIDIPISSIETNDIDSSFEEPINIHSKKTDETFSFRLSRISDAIYVKQFVKQQLGKEREEITKIKSKIEKHNFLSSYKVTDEERKKVADFERKEAFLTIEVMQACLITKYNNEDITDFTTKLDIAKKVKPMVWTKLANYMEKLNFGVSPEVTIKESPIDGKPTTRRFQFRPLEVLQNYGLSDSDDLDLSTG